MRRFLSFRFLAVLILSIVLLIFQSSMQIENGLSSNTLSKLPSDVKIELTRCLQGLSRGWDQQLVDIANGILMNESYSAEAWNDFFLEFVDQFGRPLTDATVILDDMVLGLTNASGEIKANGLYPGYHFVSVAKGNDSRDYLIEIPYSQNIIYEAELMLTLSGFSPLVNGVSSICAIGVPGPLWALSEKVVPIVSGDEDTTPVPSLVVAAVEIGNGRVVALGHDGFLINEALELFDNKRFGNNIIDWLDKLGKKKILVTTGHREWYGGDNFNSFKSWLEKCGYNVVRFSGVLSQSILSDVGVVLIGNAWGEFSQPEIVALRDFVESGGGLFLMGLGWSWEPYNPGKTLDDYPMNRIGELFGVRWIDGYVSDPTNNYRGQPIFHTFYPNIDLQTIYQAFSYIQTITDAHPDDLPLILQSDASIRNKYIKANLLLATATKSLSQNSSQRLEIYDFYKNLVNNHQKYFKREVVYNKSTQSVMAWLRERIYRSFIDALPLTLERKNEIALSMGLTCRYLDIWNDFTVLLLDNAGLNDRQKSFIYTYLSLIPRELHNLRAISVIDNLGALPPGTPEIQLWGKDGGVNIFGIDIGRYAENSFPEDVSPGFVDVFSIVVAHEINHIVDAFYIQNHEPLRVRMRSLIESAGANHMNYLRSMLPDGFFMQNPQEFFASISNQWFTNSSKTIELGLIRFDEGYRDPINQALFFAEVYSGGKNSTYFYTINSEGQIVRKEVLILRNENGHIMTMIADKIVYNFTLNTNGDVISYTVIKDENPPLTMVNYDWVWRNYDFPLILTAIDNESGIKEVYYRINGGPIMTVSVDGYPIITTENANNTLEYWSVDFAGNEEPHKILTGIKLDKTAPSTSISFDGTIGENNWFISNVTIILSAEDDLSGVDTILYSFDGVAWRNYVEPFTISDDGQFTIYFRAVDKAGNIELTKMESIKVDRTPPTGSITIKNNATYTNSTLVVLHLTAMDNASGIAKACFSNDGVWDTEPWEDYMTIKTWMLPTGDGVKTVYVQFMDKAGLISTTYYDIIILDTSVPSIIEVKRCPGGDIRPGEPVKILVNAADSLSRIRDIILSYNVGDSPAWNDVPMTLNVTSGLYEAIIQVQQVNTTVKYKITVYDNAGNYLIEDNNGQYHVYAVKVPAKFKVTELSMSAIEVKPGEAVTITVKVTNVGGETGSYTVELKIDGVAVDFKTVTLAGGESKTVTFEVTKYAMGTYDVEVDGQKGTFTVKEVAGPSSSPLIETWFLYIGAAIVTITILAIIAFLIKKKRSS